MTSSLPIPFIRLPGVSQAFPCTADFGSVVGAFLPLHVHTWDHPEQHRPFLNQCGVIRLGDLTLLSTWGSAIDGEVEQKSEAQLVLPYKAGTNFFRVGGQLVEWLLAHLNEPISLSDMEQRSHYSRRSLQFAFKRRFGCGPMQWLRQQRLAKARALIEAPGAPSSLMEISLACGYLSMASFSRDYLARDGERPSHHWRRLRHTF